MHVTQQIAELRRMAFHHESVLDMLRASGSRFEADQQERLVTSLRAAADSLEAARDYFEAIGNGLLVGVSTAIEARKRVRQTFGMEASS